MQRCSNRFRYNCVKPNIMKNLFLLLIISGCFVAFSCKEKESERFRFLTGPIWVTDSLLANGVDATGPGGILKKFMGDAKFNKDGTGYFGVYNGTWRFNIDETMLVISSDSLPLAITTDIVELTSTSLKVKTLFPNLQNFSSPINIRMTFKVK
jgi:hypothetical protein